MAENTFLTLLDKYLNKELSEKESVQLTEFLKDEEKEQLFKKHIQDIYLLKTENVTFDADKAYQKTKAKLNRKAKRPTLIVNYLARIAALLVLGLGIHYLTFTNTSEVNGLLSPTTNVVSLDLGNGQQYQLTNLVADTIKNTAQQIVGIIDNGVLNYTKNNETETFQYHTLAVPHGLNFKTVLADGTTIAVNAGSTLRYPSNFNTANERRVQLSGEAFFEVFKNKAKPFLVAAEQTIVEVVGTRFNLAAYQTEAAVVTTLEEGAVKVYAAQDKTKANVLMLQPGQQAIWEKTQVKPLKKEVENANYRDWADGKLIVKDTKFSEIIKRLERRFDVTINIEKEALKNEKFTAQFEKESIEEILTYFQVVQEFEFEVTNRTIVIQ